MSSCVFTDSLTEVHLIFSFQKSNFRCFFYLCCACCNMFGFSPKTTSFVPLSNWGVCFAQTHIDGLMWARKELHFFSVFSEEKWICWPCGCLFAYLTCRRLPTVEIWIARLQHGREIAYKFNSIANEFKRQLTLIFVLHITLLQENPILSGCRCSVTLMEWYLFMWGGFARWEGDRLRCLQETGKI